MLNSTLRVFSCPPSPPFQHLRIAISSEKFLLGVIASNSDTDEVHGSVPLSGDAWRSTQRIWLPLLSSGTRMFGCRADLPVCGFFHDRLVFFMASAWTMLTPLQCMSRRYRLSRCIDFLLHSMPCMCSLVNILILMPVVFPANLDTAHDGGRSLCPQ